MTTTEQVGRAMIRVARCGYPRPVLDSEDINAVWINRHSGACRSSPESGDSGFDAEPVIGPRLRGPVGIAWE